MKSSLMQFHWIRIICQNIFRRQQAVRRVDDPIETILLSNPEKTVALRKLVEAKDCSVRAVLFKDGTNAGRIGCRMWIQRPIAHDRRILRLDTGPAG